jgi:hypothetical protein
MADDTPATGATPAGTENQQPATPPNTGQGDNPPLGPEGEKALEAFKTRAKTAEREKKELAERLEKIEQENKSESERAIDKARKEARAEAESEFEKERRSDRLQVAVAGHARQLADVDLTVLALKQGDTDSLFDDEGKVKAKELQAALNALLKAKPHLQASGTRPEGSANGGEGQGGGQRTMNDLIRAGHR